MAKIRKYDDLTNLTDVAYLFDFYVLIPHKAILRIIAAYKYNAVFLKTEPDFYNQELLLERPDLFFNRFYNVGHTGTEDITLDVLVKLSSKAQGEQLLSQLLEASIYDCFRSGQANYQKKTKERSTLL